MRASLVLVALLAGCASTGVVPTGADSYMLADKSMGVGTAGAEVAAGLFKEANAFCGAKGRAVEVVKVDSKDYMPFVRLANAQLEFRCVAGKQ